MEGHDIPEVGKTYIDTLAYSDTFGYRYECVTVIKGEGAWSDDAFIMKHLETGEENKFQSFDWKLVE